MATKMEARNRTPQAAPALIGERADKAQLCKFVKEFNTTSEFHFLSRVFLNAKAKHSPLFREVRTAGASSLVIP
jgi:hypothetical protein